MSEWAVNAVARRRMRELTPGHAYMDEKNRNGPLAVDGQHRHPQSGGPL